MEESFRCFCFDTPLLLTAGMWCHIGCFREACKQLRVAIRRTLRPYL